jgi:hypothetical protein
MGGLDGKKNSGQRRSVFSLAPFMERTRRFTLTCYSIANSVKLHVTTRGARRSSLSVSDWGGVILQVSKRHFLARLDG